MGRQNPPTEPLIWENTSSHHFQPAFRNTGVTDVMKERSAVPA
jgi:hypothetical protein